MRVKKFHRIEMFGINWVRQKTNSINVFNILHQAGLSRNIQKQGTGCRGQGADCWLSVYRQQKNRGQAEIWASY